MGKDSSSDSASSREIDRKKNKKKRSRSRSLSKDRKNKSSKHDKKNHRDKDKPKKARSNSKNKSRSPSIDKKKEQKDKKTYVRNKKSRSRSKSIERWQKSEFIEKQEAEKAPRQNLKEEAKKEQPAAVSKALPVKNDDLPPIPQNKTLAEQDFSAPVELPDDVDEEEAMRLMMGFSGFNTTKNKDHTPGAEEAVIKASQMKRKYRQYMNRRGGFNRPLDKMH